MSHPCRNLGPVIESEKRACISPDVHHDLLPAESFPLVLLQIFRENQIKRTWLKTKAIAVKVKLTSLFKSFF